MGQVDYSLDKVNEKRLRQEWGTPQNFFDILNKECRFQLDAAASANNAKCHHYYNEKQNALTKKWVDDDIKRVWLNPGFSNMGPWAKKSYIEGTVLDDSLVVMMGRISCSAKWWNDWATKACEIRLLRPRVQFVPPEGITTSSNAQENCVIFFCQHERPEPRIWTWNWDQ